MSSTLSKKFHELQEFCKQVNKDTLEDGDTTAIQAHIDEEGRIYIRMCDSENPSEYLDLAPIILPQTIQSVPTDTKE